MAKTSNDQGVNPFEKSNATPVSDFFASKSPLPPALVGMTKEDEAQIEKMIEDRVAAITAKILASTSEANKAHATENSALERALLEISKMVKQSEKHNRDADIRQYKTLDVNYLEENDDLLSEAVVVYQMGFAPIMDYVKHGLAVNTPYNTPITFQKISTTIKGERRIIISATTVWSKKQLAFLRSHPDHIDNNPDGFRYFEKFTSNFLDKINPRDVYAVRFSKQIESMTDSDIARFAVTKGLNPNLDRDRLKAMIVSSMVDEKMKEELKAEGVSLVLDRQIRAVEEAKELIASSLVGEFEVEGKSAFLQPPAR